MPIYQMKDGTLVPFKRLAPGADLYEKQIEDMAWADLEAFTGEALFPVARQPRIPGGGIPDIVALTSSGQVVIIEVKRDVDRGQLAQVLEYAGWARLTNLDEIASLYNIRPNHQGPDAFFGDWMEFTDSTTPVTITAPPRLYLIARDFQGRTRSALDFLEENGLPVAVVPVTIYNDPSGTQIINIDIEHEPTLKDDPDGGTSSKKPPITINGQRVAISDLIADGVVLDGERVVWTRPRLGESHEATINADGTFTIADGTVWNSPSVAAIHAADVVSADGWETWRVPRLNNQRLHDLRVQYVKQHTQR